MLVKITTDYIELQQLLKLTDWISTGGEAKIAVKRLKIKLNGEPENRRGKKIYPGDVVEIQNKKYEVTKQIMYIDNLKLRFYRNYQNAAVNFINGMNVIIGDNGQGKTNLLESIYLLSTTRSHRNDDDRELINFDQEFASVETNLHYTDYEDKLGIVLHKSGKTLLINNNPVKRNSEFMGKLNAVLFAPSDMDLFDNSPRVRRKLVDIELGKLSSVYMLSLSNYLKTLKERNNYLKGNIDKIMLETYTEMLFEPEIRIIRERKAFVDDLNLYLSYFYNQISGDNDVIRVDYRSFIEEKDNKEVMREQISKNYENSLERDIYLKQTNTGIHREDYIFYRNDKEVSKYCSQGQKRMILLALKLSIVQIIFKNKKEYPILLLDDVLSELDSSKKERLLRLLPNTVQTIITTTDLKDINQLNSEKMNVIRVRKGVIE